MAQRSSKTQTESPVAAREQLEQASHENEDNTRDLEKQAREQEKQQKRELRSTAAGDDGAKDKLAKQGNVAGARRSAGFQGTGAQAGFVDQMSRRSGSDALEGHFVRIDLSAKGVRDAYDAAGLPEDFDDDYGVYMEPASVGDDGYPTTATVRLRGDTPATVTVPYDALKPSAAGRR